MAGRLKEYRAGRKQALARGKAEQELKRRRRDRHAWCPNMIPGKVDTHGAPAACGFQLFSASGRKLNFCARCGWRRGA